MSELKQVAGKEAWVTPEILTLDVGETHQFNMYGSDAGRYRDASRS